MRMASVDEPLAPSGRTGTLPESSRSGGHRREDAGEKKGLGSADSRLLQLSREAELIAKRLVPPTLAERDLVAKDQG